MRNAIKVSVILMLLPRASLVSNYLWISVTITSVQQIHHSLARPVACLKTDNLRLDHYILLAELNFSSLLLLSLESACDCLSVSLSLGRLIIRM